MDNNTHFINSNVPVIDRVRQTAIELINRYGWQLVTAEVLAQEAMEHNKSGYIQTTLQKPDENKQKRTIINIYMAHMYAACCDSFNEDRRNCAYEELLKFLHRVSYNKYRETGYCDDITQTALLKVIEKLNTCRAPETFVTFVLWQLRDAFTSYRRVEHRHDSVKVIIDPPNGDEKDDCNGILLENLLDEDAWIEDLVQRRECIAVVIAAIEALRNGKHRDILLMDLSESLCAAEIAIRLETSQGNVRKLRLDAKKQLAQDRNLKIYYAELSGREISVLPHKST